MPLARYLTHPEVEIDPDTPVRNWSLNEVGRNRISRLITAEALQGTTAIVTSDETKALETASPISLALGCQLSVRPMMHENDRSATGYLPKDEFEATADEFFANPDRSIRGWETARAAQKRIVSEVDDALTGHEGGDILFVGHGGVGALLLCHLAKLDISRDHDQKSSGGSFFSFDIETRRVHSRWADLETLI